MKERKEDSELVWAIKRFLIRALTIAAGITQLLLTLLFFASGEVKYGIFCGLAAVMLIFYFTDLVKRLG